MDRASYQNSLIHVKCCVGGGPVTSPVTDWTEWTTWTDGGPVTDETVAAVVACGVGVNVVVDAAVGWPYVGVNKLLVAVEVSACSVFVADTAGCRL